MQGPAPKAAMGVEDEKTGVSHVEGGPVLPIDPAEEARLVRKLDLYIFPILVPLYVLAFLDRTNIANARVYGLEADLRLQGNQFQLCLSLLFITYITFEFPTNLVLKKFTPKLFIPLTALAWGIISLCIGLTQNIGGVIVCRLLLGAAEAGYFPAICFYTTFWYRRQELASRIFYLFVGSAVSGVAAGLLSYAIGYMDGLRGMRAWRWIFILEGIPTILVAIVAYFVLANDPETAYYLNDRERELCRLRGQADRVTDGLANAGGRIQWDQVEMAFKDWKCWALACSQIGVTVMLYTYSSFLPSIINALGYTSISTQLLTIPCYATGAISYLVVARLSDRVGLRGPFVVGACLVACVGYAVLLSTWTLGPGVQYAGTIIVALGLYVAVGIPIAWMPNNLPSHYKRAAGQGMAMTIGNSAGVWSLFVYRTQDIPEYRLGHAFTLGIVFVSGCGFLMTSLLLRAENKRRSRGERDYRLEGKTESEISSLGDDHPEYRVTVACYH